MTKKEKALKKSYWKYRRSEKGKETRRRYNRSKRARDLAKQKRNTPEFKEYMKDYLDKYQKRDDIKANKRSWAFSWEGKAAKLLYGMRSNTKKKNLGRIEWTKEEILLAIQDQVCCKSGIPFRLQDPTCEYHKRQPFAPSPDRIDPSKGYTKENVQWVCWIYNSMRGQSREKEVKFFIENYVKHQEKRKTK